ncbi:MAG: endolytic transglycosylase MltG [Crocinitomicaceae bacterium]
MKKGLIFTVIIAIVGGGILAIPKYSFHFTKTDISTHSIDIFIPTGSNIKNVNNILVLNGVFKDSTQFVSFANEFGYNSSNLEPGKYTVSAGQKLKHILYGLKNGNQEVKDAKIVFTYSQNIPSMISKIHKSIEADSAELVNYIMSEEVISKYGFQSETIMSLFLPDTYEIGEWDMTKEEFVAFMAKQYKSFWNEDRLMQANELKLSQSDVATLASIVMSEQSKLESEWPTIAGLYLNRLQQGIKLESDPTFKFCWGEELNGVERLLYKHRDKDCPYNTYIYPGLPPGPIMLVSKKAIDAVLNYQKHNYIFMCAVGDGTSKHNFASSYAKHLRNAAIYRKNQFGK